MLRLKELREERKIKQREIADLLGTTQVTVGRYESGEREPPLTVIIQLADFYGVSVDYILCRTNVRSMATSEVRRESIESLSDDQRAIVTAFVDALIANKKT